MKNAERRMKNEEARRTRFSQFFILRSAFFISGFVTRSGLPPGS
jgi:hypothetical protein